MELGEQFEHPQLFDTADMGPAKLTESWDASKIASRPGPVGYPEHGKFEERPHERQLPMLMTAREMKAQYAAAEGDRTYRGTDIYRAGRAEPTGEWDPRAGEHTDRPRTTDDRHNERWMIPITRSRYYKRTSEPIKPPLMTDSEIWARKVEENDMTPEELFARKKRVYLHNFIYTEAQLASIKVTKIPGHEVPLKEHIAAGGDPGVIPLGMLPNKEYGNDPRPMFAGGQHRVQALHDVAPDKYVPVEHFVNTFDAQNIPKPPETDPVTGKVKRFPGEFVRRPGYT